MKMRFIAVASPPSPLLVVPHHVEQEIDLPAGRKARPSVELAAGEGENGVVGPHLAGGEVQGAGERRRSPGGVDDEEAGRRGTDDGEVAGNRPRSGRNAAGSGDRQGARGAAAERG